MVIRCKTSVSSRCHEQASLQILCQLEPFSAGGSQSPVFPRKVKFPLPVPREQINFFYFGYVAQFNILNFSS